MTDPYDVKEIRKLMPVVAAESEICGYCGARRDECPICPNTADNLHTWDSEPWKTEAICEQKHLNAIRDGFDELDAEQIKFAKRFSDSWENASKRATATDPSLLIIKNHLEDALAQLEQCTYYDPTWTYAQSKPLSRKPRLMWTAIDCAAVGICIAFVVWMFVR